MMKELIQQIFGTYEPITYTVSTTVSTYSEMGNSTVTQTGIQVASGMAGVDWEYLAGVLLFAIVLASVFKLIGVILKNV